MKQKKSLEVDCQLHPHLTHISPLLLKTVRRMMGTHHLVFFYLFVEICSRAIGSIAVRLV
ncbi:hypothetical protein OUZ56_008157 [Daphnia magna]|uniref:Uncharacterized protein n=1 Tax=Daphnia magna TaxID=35525 RepID=A0ABR0AC46_9CRUS|nr:hypothetical protein OUZ56_008157 [Daphnia magna]